MTRESGAGERRRERRRVPAPSIGAEFRRLATLLAVCEARSRSRRARGRCVRLANQQTGTGHWHAVLAALLAGGAGLGACCAAKEFYAAYIFYFIAAILFGKGSLLL